MKLNFSFKGEYSDLVRQAMCAFKKLVHSKEKVLAYLTEHSLHFFTPTLGRAAEVQLPVLLVLPRAVYELAELVPGRYEDEEGREQASPGITLQLVDLAFFSEACAKGSRPHSLGLYRNQEFCYFMLSAEENGSVYNRRFEVQSQNYPEVMEEQAPHLVFSEPHLASARLPAHPVARFFARESVALAERVRLSLQVSTSCRVSLAMDRPKCSVVLGGCSGRVEAGEGELKYSTEVRREYWPGLHQLFSAAEYVSLRVRKDGVLQLQVEEDDKYFIFGLLPPSRWDWDADI